MSRPRRTSAHVTAFAHMGEIYLYHDLYGYILQMSADVHELLRSFDGGRDLDELSGEQAGFAATFEQCACLVTPDADELEPLSDMVPVKSRWNVWHRAGPDPVTITTAWRGRVETHRLTAAETAMWDRIDGETSIAALGDGALELAVRLVHHDVQALKLSPVPMRVAGRAKPAYLSSTMPYARWHPSRGSDPDLATYHREHIGDAQAQFDHQETTLSHLLREPHPALGGRTYGRALLDALIERDAIDVNSRVRVLEIGGGLGYVAKEIATGLVEIGADVSYDIVELSPVLADAQRRRCAGLPVTIAMGDALEIELAAGAYDLIVANEMIGDLPAQKYTHADRDSDKLHPIIEELGVDVGNAPDPFYVNVGALELVVRIHDWLAEGGVAVLTEFGHASEYPRVSTHLDHAETSIHFGHVQSAATAAGFTARVEPVIDLLKLDCSLRGLSTTRSYFAALQAMLAEHGIELQKIGYTAEMFAAATSAMEGVSFGDIRFHPIEDRLMGLVPHEFHALVLHM